MGIRLEILRTDFYNELSDETGNKYFAVKEKKFLPAIDNIYYTVFLHEDTNENHKLKGLFEQLEESKQVARTTNNPQAFTLGLQVLGRGYNVYKYCLSQPDLYDIFILDYLPNEDTPRILIQIRAFGLWLHGADKMLLDSYNTVRELFGIYRCQIRDCRENRIDYCYHTNIIANPEKLFSDKSIERTMTTTMEYWQGFGRLSCKKGGTQKKHDYFALGRRKSNSVFVRIYDKVLEVIEEGYKGFFFDMWEKAGLISFYDRYCFEYAYCRKDYKQIHKAKLLFYLEHGTDEKVKIEFKGLLSDKNMKPNDYQKAVQGFMPEVTRVTNIEFETKRKFYYYSDDHIQGLPYQERDDLPEPLKRIYRITDNRSLFLDYLTEKTLHFKGAWWERLRNTKLGGLKLDEKLMRVYSVRLDEQQAKVRVINSVATAAVYNDNIQSGFVEDVADLLSNMNDNHKQNVQLAVFLEDGEVADLTSGLLLDYRTKKIIKDRRLKNRKKENARAAEDQTQAKKTN